MHLNKPIFDFLNGLAKRNDILDMFWVFLAQYAIFLFGIVLIYFVRKDRKLLLKAALGIIITVITVAVIKTIWFIPRPFSEKEVNLLIEHREDSTFPSKHAAVAFTAAFGIFLQKKKLGIWLLLLALGIALSRVIAGVHYPLDILAGAIIGISIAGVNHRLPFYKIGDNSREASPRKRG